MRPSTMRWAQRGITYWLQEDLSVMIMKWSKKPGCKIQRTERQEADA